MVERPKKHFLSVSPGFNWVIQVHLDIQPFGQPISLITMTLPGYDSVMSKLEILEELPRLTAEDRLEIRRKLNEIDGDGWMDGADPLTDAEKALLEARLAAYEKDPDAGSSWEEVESRIQDRLTA
jgi:putative addiction module component (TIGR02574 family)